MTEGGAIDAATRRELHDLMSALLDGALAPGQDDRLRDLLAASPEARDLYLDYFELHAALAARPAAGDPRPAERPAARPGRQAAAWVVAGLAALTAGLLAAVALRGPSPAGAPPVAGAPAEVTDDGVAVLLQSHGAVWDDTGLPTRPGSALPPGRLALRAGVAHVQFYSGATVILEGPADFRLISPLEAYCGRGKLRVTVPPQAQGFTVGSPKLDLIDRGTEFGLSVGGGATEVHVFQGSVELYDAGTGRAPAGKTELTTGRALRVDGEGTGRAMASDPAAFLTARELAARSDDQLRRRFDEWKTASEALRADPRLLAYYTFQPEQPWDRTLRDRSAAAARDGAVVGCEWAAGRWPGKQALEFKRPGDRVRVHVPGEYDALTLAAWVRLDALDHPYTGLMLTDRWGDGSVHWQFDEVGTLILNVKRSQGQDNRTRTGRVLGADVLGRWTHVAAVYDDRAGLITHYLNGQAVGEFAITYPTPLRVNAAEIGNYGSPFRAESKSPLRNLNGRMDEFALFDAALTGAEIAALYQAGRPNP